MSKLVGRWEVISMSRKKDIFKKDLINKPIRSTLCISGFLMCMPLVILITLRFVDWCARGWCEGLFTRLEGGIDTWFSFYGSYLGVLAAVVSGLITLRLSIKIDLWDRVSKLSDMYVRTVSMYDFLIEYKPSVMVYNEENKRYCFQITFEKYQPYYQIDVLEVEWGTFEDSKESRNFQKINGAKAYFEQKEMSRLYIYCDDFKENIQKESLNYYYHLLAYEPITMKSFERKRILKIKLKMREKLFEKQPEDFDVILEIILENKEYKENCMNLECLDYDISINI